jgi:site-specific recombinase XerD
MRGHEKALFLSQKHQRMTVRQIERLFKNLLRELGLDREGFTPHSLRHGFARAKLDDGVGLRQLQRLMDHASIRTTEEYLDAEEEELTEAMGRGVPEDA